MMKILNQIHALTGDWSDGELVRDAMLKGCKKILSLMEELKEAQSYKADAERYQYLKNSSTDGLFIAQYNGSFSRY